MAETPQELAERLKAMGNKPIDAFTAPTPESSVTTEPKLPTVDKVNLTDNKPPVVIKPAEVKPTDDINPQMTNLIKMAEKRNETLRQKLDKLPDLAHAVATFNSNSAKVMQILKDHGMDSQQAEKAFTQLVKLTE